MAAEHLEPLDRITGFPLIPIPDESTYRAAIAILDRLFALAEPRTPAELTYFHALARLARAYEIAPARRPEPGGEPATGRRQRQPRLAPPIAEIPLLNPSV